MGKDYFELIERINSKGPYQRNIFLVFFMMWFVSTYILIGVSFLFIVAPFKCQNISDPSKCKEFVCDNVPQSKWKDYVTKTPEVQSMADEFGDYHCEDQEVLGLYKMILFAGAFVGYQVLMYFVDNFGRRFGMILCWLITLIGTIIICVSVEMWMACIGLFIAGAGCEASIRVNLAVLNQIIDFYKRQTYSILLQTSFGLGGVSLAITYYYIVNWRIVMIIFCALPSFVILLYIFFYMEEVPRFLIKQGKKQMFQALKRIAVRNKRQPIPYTQIEQIVDKHNEEERILKQSANPPKKYSTVDLCKFPSLRKISIPLGIVFLFFGFLYYGPSAIIDKFSFNLFVAQLLLSVSDCIAYPTASFFIKNIKRRKFSVIAYCIVGASFLIGFIANTQGEGTAIDVIRMVSLFSGKFFLCLATGVIFLHTVELYPTVVRGIGFGTVSATGAIGAGAVQITMSYLTTHNQDPLLYLGVLSVITAVVYFFIPETLNKPLRSEIEEEKENNESFIKQKLITQHENFK